MHFVLIGVLILAQQVDYSSAACNSLSSQAPLPPSTPTLTTTSTTPTTTITAATSSATLTTTTAEATTSTNSLDSAAISSSRASIMNGDMSALLQLRPSSNFNDSNQNKSQLSETNANSSRAGGDHVSTKEIHEFRLEYNKYKILSHLSITGNLDEIAYDIDDGVRKQLVATTALTNPNNSSSSARHKRSLSCGEVKSDKNACCLESFYVNFTHIGWDKWILYPTGYNANYCRGQCDLSHARYYHSTLLSKYSNLISLCCSPKQMAPLKLLYIDEENKVHQKSIPDMIVESCDCA